MEVHSHSHTVPIAIGRKKWTHYFWEFLMLFLAVFSGFLAENWREHYIEHKRSLELAIYDQIKQAGFLRYFQKELGNALVRYESKRNLAALQLDMENKFVLENIITLLNKLSNQKFLRYREKDSVPVFGEPLIKKNSSLLSELYGDIRFLQKRNLNYLYTLNDLYFLAGKSIDLINEEFKLK